MTCDERDKDSSQQACAGVACCRSWRPNGNPGLVPVAIVGERLMRIISLAIVAVLVGSGVVVAQEARAYVGGALMFSTQPASSPENAPDMPKPGVGGTAPGIAATIGGFLSPRISVAFEFSLPDRFDTVQTLHYFQVAQIEDRHRDLILSGLLHVHGTSARRIRPELVVGLSYVSESTLQRTAYQIGSPATITDIYGPYGPEMQITRTTWGVTGGVDIGVALNRHVSIVPQVRLHGIRRADFSSSSDTNSAFLALGPFAIRAAVGLRATF